MKALWSEIMKLEYYIPIAAVLGYLVGYFIKSYQLKQYYQFQNLGENLVRETLTNHFPVGSWHLLNNITLQLEDGTTQIDHILISRFGVFVIETKHYSGWIFGDTHTKEWTQSTLSRFGPNKYRFMNPLHQNYKHVKAVQAVLDFLPPEDIKGLVVFTGEAEFKKNRPQGIYILETLVYFLKNLSTEVMTENRRQFCIGRLETKRLALTRETDIEHQQNIQARRGSLN